jgi:hypothetical protein
VLSGNIHTLPRFEHPVLGEGSAYPGLWQECGPQEALVYSTLAPFVSAANAPESAATPIQIARNNHMIFFALQREDGQLPHPRSSPTRERTQVVADRSRWSYPSQPQHGSSRSLPATMSFWSPPTPPAAAGTRGSGSIATLARTGLVEGFCAYDTGHDNSPRWAGIPNRCPDDDARKCPPIATLPRLCPDLSATVYGGRSALAHMAAALGKPAEAERWHTDAETIRHLIIERLYDAKDAAFYDLDAQNSCVRIHSDAISRVFGEHVLHPVKDRIIIDAVWTRQLHNPRAFWAPYPLTSIAIDDPAFVRPVPRNSWGGPSQALTALRAPRSRRRGSRSQSEARQRGEG